MTFTLPTLSYEYDALEPHIDAKTMEIHHTRHHQAYINNLNKVIGKYPRLRDKKLEDMMAGLDSLPFDDKDRTVFRNNGGGHLNHSFFWTIMGPVKEVDEELVSAINKEFSSVEEFKKEFKAAATGRFGSGWAWLVKDRDDKLSVTSTANQDSPFISGHTPLIGLDIWEHAYYLKYQNKRDEYIDSWWNVLKLI